MTNETKLSINWTLEATPEGVVVNETIGDGETLHWGPVTPEFATRLVAERQRSVATNMRPLVRSIVAAQPVLSQALAQQRNDA